MTTPSELDRLQRQARWEAHRSEKLREHAALRREAEDTGRPVLDHRWALPERAPTWWEPLTPEGAQPEEQVKLDRSPLVREYREDSATVHAGVDALGRRRVPAVKPEPTVEEAFNALRPGSLDRIREM